MNMNFISNLNQKPINLSKVVLVHLLMIFHVLSTCENLQKCHENIQCIIYDPIHNTSICPISIGQSPVTYKINLSPTYLIYKPPKIDFDRIYFYFKGEKLDKVFNLLQYVIENEDSNAYPNLNSTTVYVFNTSDEWRDFYLQNIYFKKKKNGQYTTIIFAISLSHSLITQQMSTYVMIRNQNYYVPLIFGIFGILSIFSFLLILIFIRKKYFIKRDSQVTNHKNQLQLLNKYLPKRKYLNQSNESNDLVCSICLINLIQGNEVRSTPCGHTYHIDCFDQWYFKNPKCPICRDDLQIQKLIKKLNSSPEILLNQIKRGQKQEINIESSLLEQQSKMKETEMIIPLQKQSEQL